MTGTTTTPPIDDLDRADRVIVGLVAAERAENHRGPSWRELRAALGLPPPPEPGREVWQRAKRYHQAEGVAFGRALRAAWPDRPPDPANATLTRRLRRLREAGWITFSDRPRSLDIGPTLLEAFRAARRPRRDEAGGIIHLVAVVVLALLVVGLVASQGGAGAVHTAAHLISTGWHTVGSFIASHKPTGGTS